MSKSPMDSRNHAIPLQLLDHTGATNFAPFKRYGVEQSLNPKVKTISPNGVEYKQGVATMQLGGKSLADVGGNTMEGMIKKEHLDRKEKMQPRTTDQYLKR